ncbi:hypothetical protein EDI_082260 [Entamoeba dispar SAW760]|uniref:Uncharacterized protein n=1 Tax=Entamoeba dispar (strain ATCC PRA-260 / SAW760) TaxID=370354 RepID=B0ERL1_ENTDS|nr:uncharacterized protein EDI_082260 [Entamoeba dispar SAW760]EDR22815.1 hypothetical protein EDI_082260 [Entamoeba dispar SAW760]|eukprot:EDR22815.1 hypothetical protein EDI_082260 [Entamoeba dispar SAW760]
MIILIIIIIYLLKVLTSIQILLLFNINDVWYLILSYDGTINKVTSTTSNDKCFNQNIIELFVIIMMLVSIIHIRLLTYIYKRWFLIHLLEVLLYLYYLYLIN